MLNQNIAQIADRWHNILWKKANNINFWHRLRSKCMPMIDDGFARFGILWILVLYVLFTVGAQSSSFIYFPKFPPHLSPPSHCWVYSPLLPNSSSSWGFHIFLGTFHNFRPFNFPTCYHFSPLLLSFISMIPPPPPFFYGCWGGGGRGIPVANIQKEDSKEQIIYSFIQ